MKKITVMFCRIPNGSSDNTDAYRVTKAVNTLNWKPGEIYPESQVQYAMRNSNNPKQEFIITERKVV